MTTLEMPVQRGETRNNAVRHRKQSYPIKLNRPTYVPWREPLSVRQVSALFESTVFPDLNRRLESLFHNLYADEREEAVQDCACQAFEAYRTLKLYIGEGDSSHLMNVSSALAEHVAAQYLAGVRFASPRTESRL